MLCTAKTRRRGRRGNKRSRPTPNRPARGAGSEAEAKRAGTAKRRQTKRGGKGVRGVVVVLIVPLKTGNPPQGTRRMGSGRPDDGACGGTDGGDIGPRGHLNATRQDSRPMVPESSALEGARPARGAVAQAARALCLLRHDGELPGAAAIPHRSRSEMVQVARPEKLERAHDMGTIHAPAEDLSSPPCARGAQCVPLSSETIVRGAGCGKAACPDLWEPRAGNCPRPPGLRGVRPICEISFSCAGTTFPEVIEPVALDGAA